MISAYGRIEKMAADALEEVRELGTSRQEDATAQHILGGALATIERAAHDAQHAVINPERARVLLGMEEHAFAQKWLTDAAFHAAIEVIIQLELTKADKLR